MYERFYGFTKKPFSISPDPNFIYLNSDYREALAMLQYGIAQRKGVVCLIGEVGTGKTMLINTLLKGLDRQVTPILLSCPELSYRELIEFVRIQLGIRVCSKNPSEQISALYKYLLDAKQLDRTVVLIIDEAQSLSVKMLEFLRLLSNLETTEEKLIQILLSGQPELKGKLNLPELRQFKQRIAISFQLGPLKPEEVPLYIAHRLKVSGYTAGLRLFTDQAMESIQEYSTGIPRLINAICENALATGYVLSKHQIDKNIVEEAARDLMLEKPQAHPKDNIASADAQIIPLILEPPLPESRTQKRYRAASCLRFLAVPTALAAIFWFIVAGWHLLKDSPEKGWIEASPQRAVHRFIDQNLTKIKTYFSLVQADGAGSKGPEGIIKTDTARDPPAETDFPSVQDGTISHESSPDNKRQTILPVEYVSGEADSPERWGELPVSVSLSKSSENAEAASFGGSADPDDAPPTVLQPEEKEVQPTRIVRSGDTICKILIETYGVLTPYVWGLVHLANPGIRDLNLIITGSPIHLPRLSPESKIFGNNAGAYLIYLNAATDPAIAEMGKRAIEMQAEIEVDISFVQLTSNFGLYLLQAGRFATHRAALDELKKLSEIASISKILEAKNEPNIRTAVAVKR